MKLTLKETILLLVVIAIVFITAFTIGWNYGYQGFAPISYFAPKPSSMSHIVRALHIIDSHYDGPVDSQALLQSLVFGLNDPYSYYVTKSEYEKLKASYSGHAVGVGVQYTRKEKLPIVIEVYPDSPAFIAGIEVGDIIIAVDDQRLDEMPSDVGVLHKIKGNAGEKSIFIIENRDKNRRNVVITRESFEIPTFAYKTISPQISYLKVYQFSSTLPKEFKNIHEKILSDKPTRLIIDLRNNFGGDTQSGIFFADQFIKKGILVREKFKNSKSQDISSATETAAFPNLPIFVLVNGETSSAAEVVTAAFQDNARGVIVGSKTFGKGTTGNLLDLSDGSAIHLTIGKWFTPNDIWIGGVGIEPDISVEDDPKTSIDEALVAALEAMEK